MPVHAARYFELTYDNGAVKYLTLVGDAGLDAALETGLHKTGLRLVREIALNEVPKPVAEPVEAPIMGVDQTADLIRQNQILAAALDELAGKHNALKDYAEAIARHAILPPELKKGAA